tara:strand:- start:152 stop:271 length:120 start_codon:yes stop_codon:yes gene_type:complete
MEKDPKQYKQPKHVLNIVFDGIEEIEALASRGYIEKIGG